MKKRKSRLAELRSGQAELPNKAPSNWLIEAVGQSAAWAAALFGADHVELVTEGVVLRIKEKEAIRG